MAFDLLHFGPREHPAIVALLSTAESSEDKEFLGDILFACGRDLLLLHPGLKYEAFFEEGAPEGAIPDEVAEGDIPQHLIYHGYQDAQVLDKFYVYLLYFPDGRVGVRINTSNSSMNSGVNTYLWPVKG